MSQPLPIGEFGTLALAIAVVFLGRAVNGWIPVLGRAAIPPAVTGGVLASVILTLATLAGAPSLSFASGARGVLLLVFFATVGMGAKLRAFLAGGLGALAFGLCALVLMVAQNAAGSALARVFGHDPLAGLFVGSVPFLGGHGTTAAWAATPAAAAVADALAMGMAAATIGLILGGLVGGPLGSFLAARARGGTAPSPLAATAEVPALHARHPEWQATDRWLASGIAILGALILGEGLVRLGAWAGVTVPGFLGALLGGALLTNLADLARNGLDRDSIDITGTVALRVFLALSLIGLDLWSVGRVMPFVLTAALMQAVLTAAVAAFLVFPLLGRDREAAAAAGGFCGLGLGATPVAMGVVRRLEGRYGATPRAVLVITLAVGFLIDPLNALVVSGGFALLAR